jgi:asparagine synthase (glutamine-hydrolysing)
MCGIAGIIGRVDGPRREALGRMATALAHRGPDGQGVWESQADDRGWGCLLAHRRLSILDLSDAAAQPMVDPATGAALSFNGEIYNYQALRAGLVAAGETFSSSGDTAVLSRLLALHGADAAERLRGMFAYAYWDARLRELTLTRDPLGIKPLYVVRNPDRSDGAGWSLAFASELRALLASGLIERPRLDPAAVEAYVWNGFVPGPGTAVAGVESLWPGEYRVFDGHGAPVRDRRFWAMPHTEPGAAGGLDAAREALLESCRLHMVSDVPIGLFLSSGVDSSAVANLSQKLCDQPLNTFTMAFEEAEYDESPAARRIAAAIGTNHQEILLTESEFVANLEQALGVLDQPTFDALNTYYVSWAVRRAGIKVALAGTGGDEHFGGYSSFRTLPKLQSWSRRTRWVPAWAKARVAQAVSSLIQGGPARRRAAIAPQTRWAKLPAMVESGDDLIALYQLAYALFLPEFRSELLGATPGADGVSGDGLPAALRARLGAEIDGHPPLEAISILEYRCFLGERLLRDSDVVSMAVGLELRVPLIDQDLVRQFFHLDEASRYRPVGSKRVLRTLGLEGLDPALFDRPKRGFVMPFDRWIRRNLFRSMDETLRDRALAESVGLRGDAIARLWEGYQAGAPGLYWSRVWSLYILLDWCRRHGLRL